MGEQVTPGVSGWGEDRPSGHGHLWTLADGTGLHAPYGSLSRGEDGRVCCHLCGRWYVALGSHVRVHGYTADAYRCAMGLLSSRGLVGPELSEHIRHRARERYESSARVRQDLAQGQEMARAGQLAWRRRAARPQSPEPAQRVRERREQLAAGRATQEAARRQQLAERLDGLGATALPSYLRTAYVAGASLNELGRATGLGHRRLREALLEAAGEVRPAGVNTAAGKQARARAADARAAERLGVTDLRAWLRDRRAEGWTLQRLGDAVGHTGHWVSWRLQDASAHDG